jgi:hypothetical protein
LALLADAYGAMGQRAATPALLVEALTLMDSTGAHWHDQRCIGSKANPCCNSLLIIRLKPNPASSTSLTSLAINKPNP